MQSVRILIDLASKICGSDAELCRRAQISPALLSLMRLYAVLHALFAWPGRRAALRLHLAAQAMRRLWQLWPLPDRQTAEALRALFIKHEQTKAIA